MSKQTNLYLTQNINLSAASLSSTDTTVYKTIYTAPADGAVIKAFSYVTNDGTTINLKVAMELNGLDAIIGTVNIPINSGTNGTANAVDILNSTAMAHLPYDRNGKKILPLKGGTVLKIAPLATITAAKYGIGVVIAEEY